MVKAENIFRNTSKMHKTKETELTHQTAFRNSFTRHKDVHFHRFVHFECVPIYNRYNIYIIDIIYIYIYICDGYQQQQPIVITRCFMGFTQSSDDYTILFNL